MSEKYYYHGKKNWPGQFPNDHEGKDTPVTDDLIIGNNGFEFTVSWLQLGKDSYARLQVFEDSWVALDTDLLAMLHLFTAKNPAPEDIISALENMGYTEGE